MSHAFDTCTQLIEAPRYIKSALDMSYCFSNCGNIGRPVLADDTENAAYAFYNCGNNLTELLFTNNLVNCRYMYYSSRSVNKIKDIARRSGNIFIYAENIQDFNYTFPPFPQWAIDFDLNIYVIADSVTNTSLFNSHCLYFEDEFNNNKRVSSTLKECFNQVDEQNNCWYCWNNKANDIFFYWKSLDEMKQLDTNNWYSNGIHK